MITFKEFSSRVNKLRYEIHKILQNEDFKLVSDFVYHKKLQELEEIVKEPKFYFDNFLLEGINSGILHSSSNSREGFWNEHKDTGYFKKVLDNISSVKYDLYKEGSSKFYLILDNEYKGYLEFDGDKITSSHSKLQRGFYNLIFTTILSNKIKDKIISDKILSNQAIQSYMKLALNGNLEVKITNGQEEFDDISEEKYTENSINRYVVRLKQDEEVLETFRSRTKDYELFCEQFYKEI